MRITFDGQTRTFGVKDFVKKHKKKILIGGAVAAAALAGKAAYNEATHPSHKENVKAHRDALMNHEEGLRQKFGLSSREFDMLARLSMAITEQETKFGDSLRYKVKRLVPDTVMETGRWLAGRHDGLSRGYGQVKYDIRDDKTKSIMKGYGVTPKNVEDSASNSAILTFGAMAEIYKRDIKGKSYYDKDGNRVDDATALRYFYNGRGGVLKRGEATPSENLYVNNTNRYLKKQELQWDV